MANPQLGITCHIGFSATPASDITAVSWTDVTAYLRLQDGVSLTRGRQDETGQVGAGSAMFSLNNRDGRFTPGNTSGAYYPNVKLRRPVQFRDADGDPIWTGYVEEWGEGWNNGKQPFVRVRAADLMARLANRTLGAMMTEEQTYDTPVLYFPLNDSEGATTAGDQSTYMRQALAVGSVGSGGSTLFGQAGGFAADADTPVLVLTRSDASNGKYLTQSYNPLPELAAVTGVTLECYVYLPVSVSGTVRVLELSKPATTDILALDLATNVPVAKVTIGGSTVTATASGGAINDGAWHHVAAWYDGTNVKVYVDGTATSAAAALGTLTSTVLSVGGTNTGTTLANAWLSGVAVYNSALTGTRITAHATARLGGTGETSLARFNRIVRLAIGSWAQSASAATPSATMSAQPFTGQSASTLLYGVSDAEVSPVYISAAGVPVWRARSERTPSASPTSISATVVDSSTGFSTSDQLVLNSLTLTRPAGATVTVTDTASVTAYGKISESRSIYYDTDAQLAGAANYIVNSRSTPQVRTGALTVDLVTTEATVASATLLALDVGSVLRVTSVPRGSGSQVDVFVEGVNDYISATAWRRTWNTSPLQIGGQVWLLGSTTYSVLGSTTILGF